MKIRKHCKILPFCLSLLLTVSATLGAPQTERSEAPTQPVLPQKLLGIAYVDIRKGFSVRPPFGCDLTGGSGGPGPTTALENIPLLADWQLLKSPESQELVRFVDPRQKRALAVHLLVTREKMDIERMQEARKNYWQKYPNKAAPEQSQTEQIKNRPTALLTLTWRGAEAEPNQAGLTVREAVIQVEEDRFFLLTLTSPAGVEQPPRSETFMKAVLSGFVSFDKQEQKRRGKQARKRAQEFLEQLEFDRIWMIRQKNTWFRIIHGGEDIGFYRIIEAGENQPGQKTVKVQVGGFIKKAAQGAGFLQLAGWNRDSTGAVLTNAGAIRLEAKFLFDYRQKTENFRYQIRSADSAEVFYGEEGLWKEKTLQVKRFDDPQNPAQATEQKLEVGAKIYLPATYDILLGRLLEHKIGDEYIFLRYSNRAIHYYALHVAARVKLKITDNESPEQSRYLPATYLTGRTGPEGPIVQTWLNKRGHILKLLAGEITLLRSTAEKIKQLWPEEMEKVITLPPAENNN